MTTKKTSMARMTWKEVEEIAEQGTVVLLPVAAVEQHGLQTPTGIDLMVAEHFCEEVSARTNAVYLPAVPFGCSQFYARFPGTIAIRPTTLHAYLKDICVSLVRHGFTHILFVDNHLGNSPVVEHVAWELREELEITPARVFPYAVGKALGRDLFGSDVDSWGHGSEPVGSMAAALAEADMRMDLAQEDKWLDVQGQSATAPTEIRHGKAGFSFYFDERDVSSTGTKGNPHIIDGERGTRYLQRIVDFGVEVVETFSRMDTRVGAGTVRD